MKSWLAHILLPRKSNRHRPLLLHPNGLATIATVVVALHIGLAVVLHFPIFPDVLGRNSQITIADVLTHINQERSTHHLPSLQLNEQLNRAAQQKAEDMLQKSYWAHTSPDGRQPWDFIDNS